MFKLPAKLQAELFENFDIGTDRNFFWTRVMLTSLPKEKVRICFSDSILSQRVHTFDSLSLHLYKLTEVGKRSYTEHRNILILRGFTDHTCDHLT